MSIKRLLCATAIAVSALGVTAPASAQLALPTDGNYLQYGDFQSYSMPILAYYYDKIYGGGVGPGNPYYIPSSPGNIADNIVIYTGAGGPGSPISDNSAPPIAGTGFVDNPFASPNGVQTPYFQTSDPAWSTGDPTPNPPTAGTAGDINGTWDISLTKLSSFLDGNADNLAFLFNNNETNEDQTLAAWGRIWVTDASQTMVTNLAVNNGVGTFCFSNNGAQYGAGGMLPGSAGASAYTCSTDEQAGDPLVTTATGATDYVASGGEVCINAAGAFVACNSDGAIKFNHNLGANQVAYAITSFDLNDLLASLFAGNVEGYTMHVDLHLGCDPQWDPIAADEKNPDKALADSTKCDLKKIDNGYEQLFMVNLGSPFIVPEPNTLALLALALFGFAGTAKLRGKRG